MRFHFILNPAAGRVRLPKFRAALKEEFAGHEYKVSASVPGACSPDSRPGRSDLVVVAAGEDGTIHRAVRALAGTDVPLGVFPLGGANDFARGLSIPPDFRKACEILRRGHVEAIDLIQVNGIPLATGGGLGLAAAVSDRANRWKQGVLSRLAKLLGPLVYPLAALVEILRGWKPFEATVSGEGDGRDGEGEGAGDGDGDDQGVSGGDHGRRLYAAVLIANQDTIGRWFRLSSGTVLRSGSMHLCEIVSPASRLRMFWVCTCLLTGRAARCPEIRLRDLDRISIRTREPMPFFADGEAVAQGKRFILTLRRRALRVIVPLRPEIEDRHHAA